MNLWMVLVVLVCAEVKARVEDVVVELGQTITLNCSLEVSKTFWFMKVHSGLQSCISRNLDKDGNSVQYHVFNHVNKFLTQGNKLQVLNISQSDLRVYCCGPIPEGTTMQCKDAYRLKTVNPDTTPPLNNTDHQNQNQNQNHNQNQNWPHWVVLTSLGLNAVLMVVVTGLGCKLCLKRKKSAYDPSAQTNQSPETLDAVQYEEIILPEYRDPPPNIRPPECIYYKAQLPRSSH